MYVFQSGIYVLFLSHMLQKFQWSGCRAHEFDLNETILSDVTTELCCIVAASYYCNLEPGT